MTWAPTAIAVLLIGYATVSRRLEGLNVSGANLVQCRSHIAHKFVFMAHCPM